MASPTKEEAEPSYIDYETFLAPDFRPSAFANTLVLATNNPNDAPLDLSTPLSRVLFDIQEIDSHIDLLTTRSALPLLAHTRRQNEASGRIIAEVDGQVRSLNDSYRQLEREVIQKHAEADEVRQVASRLWETLRLGRAAGRCLQLGRQLEVQHAELGGGPSAAASSAPLGGRREDHRALVRCAHTILSLREVLDYQGPGEEGHGLDKVDAVRCLQTVVIAPTERSVRETAERIVREFSMGPALPSSSAATATTRTFAQAEEIRARTISALTTLYLLSPTKLARGERWTPALMLQALEVYLRSALQSSVAAMARSLSALPTLDRTLAEVSARCQSIVAIELLLEGARAPVHPLHPTSGAMPSKQSTAASIAAAAAAASAATAITTPTSTGNLLQPLLAHLETGSLASYFWRTLAGSLSGRVGEIMGRGGVAARTLRSNRNSVSDAIRDCVLQGVQPPNNAVAGGGSKTKGRLGEDGVKKATSWEREIGVMQGSVVNHLGR